MLVAIASSALDRGWSAELIFSEDSTDRLWLAELERAEIPYRFIKVGRRSGAGRWASWVGEEATACRLHTPLTAQIREVLGECGGPTILHTHFSSFDVAAAHAARGNPRARVIWHRHGMRRPGHGPFVAAFLNYRVFARNVDEVICVGPHLAEDLRRFAGASRVSFVPNGIDVGRFTPARPAERELVRQQLEISYDATLLLHFGWYWHLKGGDLFLEAVKSLLRNRAVSNLRAITIGRDEARSAVAAAGLQPYVAVLEPIEEIRALYAAADVLISPSRAEGVPLAVFEALAMGLPVVASDIPGHAYVGSAVRACRLAPLDGSALAGFIAEVLGLDAATRNSERDAARAWVASQLDLRQWTGALMERYDNLFRAIVAREPARAR
jgi:glycosyltransferase involved in cell wall biosynthesis